MKDAPIQRVLLTSITKMVSKEINMLSLSVFSDWYDEPYLPRQEILQNFRHSAKVINSEFYLCPHSNSIFKKVWLTQKILTQTDLGSRHNKSII